MRMQLSPASPIRPQPCALLLGVALAIAATSPLAGQVTAPAAPAKAPSADAPIVLSPFTVATEKDEGFVANSSLAGGRMTTDLRDTAAAYSVLTRDFIDAVGIVDLRDAVEWTVNSATTPDNGSNPAFGDELTINFRGVSANRQQRNFFPYYVNFDSYNLDRFDFARGPNSILFGNGSFGGTSNAVTKQARPAKAARELQLQVGSWGQQRVVADDNLPLSKSVALRTNLLWQDTQGWRDHDFDKRHAVFLTGSWQVNRALQVRAEGEYGYSRKLNSLSTLGDNLSGWDGVSTYSVPQSAAPADANARGVSRNGTGYYVYAPATGVADLISWTGSMVTLGGNANAAVPVGGQLVTGPLANIASQSMLAAGNLPASRFDKAIAGSKFRVPARSFSVSPDAPLYTQRYKNCSLFVNHQWGDSLFAEIAGSWGQEMRNAEMIHVRGLTNTYLDINQNLPTGTPNPNFLVPYNESSRYYNVRDTSTKNARGALAYVKNSRLGDFRFNALGGFYEERYRARLYVYNTRLAADHRTWSSANFVRYRYYWSQQGRPLADLPAGIKLIDPLAGTNSVIDPDWVLDNTRSDLSQDVQSPLKYLQLAGSAKLFRGRLNLLAAVRRDDYKTATQYTDLPGDYATDWNGRTLQYRPNAPSDFFALSYRPKDAAGNPTGAALPADTRPRAANGDPLPQYAGDRFRDDFNAPTVQGKLDTYSVGGVFHATRWLSVYANFAETYNPPPPGISIIGALFPAQTSQGGDAGLRFTLLGGKLHVSLGAYRGKEINQAVQPGTASAINNILRSIPVGGLGVDGRNKRGEPDIPGVYYDSRDRSNRGTELEMVANLSTSWRLLLNAARAEAYQENPFPQTLAWLSQKDAVLRQIVADTGVLIDARNVATVDATIPTANRSPSANTCAQNWNSLQDLVRNFVTGKQKIARVTEATANLFSDYTFRSGWAKGLKLGAGLNYRGRQVLGFRGTDTVADPANPAAAIDDPNVNAYSCVYSDPYYLVTASAGYSWRLLKRTQVSLNLRVDNVLNEDQVLYYNTTLRPVGGNLSSPARTTTPNAYAYQVPRRYNLSCTLRF